MKHLARTYSVDYNKCSMKSLRMSKDSDKELHKPLSGQ